MNDLQQGHATRRESASIEATILSCQALTRRMNSTTGIIACMLAREGMFMSDLSILQGIQSLFRMLNPNLGHMAHTGPDSDEEDAEDSWFEKRWQITAEGSRKSSLLLFGCAVLWFLTCVGFCASCLRFTLLEESAAERNPSTAEALGLSTPFDDCVCVCVCVCRCRAS